MGLLGSQVDSFDDAHVRFSWWVVSVPCEAGSMCHWHTRHFIIQCKKINNWKLIFLVYRHQSCLENFQNKMSKQRTGAKWELMNWQNCMQLNWSLSYLCDPCVSCVYMCTYCVKSDSCFKIVFQKLCPQEVLPCLDLDLKWLLPASRS